MTDLLRPELVEASVLRSIVTGLPALGITKQVGDFVGEAPNVVVRDAFPTPDERNEELVCTTIAFGYNENDGGVAAELGTTLTKYVHSLTVWVFALEPSFGRHVAYGIEKIARQGQSEWGLPDTIPLLDFNSDPTDPDQIDLLSVLSAKTAHVANTSVRPFDRYLWTVTVDVQDIAYA